MCFNFTVATVMKLKIAYSTSSIRRIRYDMPKTGLFELEMGTRKGKVRNPRPKIFHRKITRTNILATRTTTTNRKRTKVQRWNSMEPSQTHRIKCLLRSSTTLHMNDRSHRMEYQWRRTLQYHSRMALASGRHPRGCPSCTKIMNTEVLRWVFRKPLSL